MPGLWSYWISSSGMNVRLKSKITTKTMTAIAIVARRGSRRPTRSNVARSPALGG